MKLKYKVAVLLIWMILIFHFSHQPADVSNKNNEFVTQIFEYLGMDLNGALGELTDFIIRKAAHFTEYFILFLLINNVFKEHISLKTSLIYSLIGVFIYACTDEVHQLFIVGRAGKFTDVMVDTSGGLLALFISWIRILKKEKGLLH